MQKKKFHTSSSALIIIIVTMMLISVLSLTVVSLTGTGALDTVVYNNNKRAYYLAESGYRYAAGLYLNTENKDEEGTADDEKAEVLRNQIDGGAYTLPDGGKFFLTAFPYWLMPNSDYMGQILGTFHFPGQIPKDFGIPEAGVMAYSHAEKEGEKIALFHYSGAVVSSSTRTITCTLGARLAAGLFCDIKTKDALFLALPLSLSGNSTVGLTGGSLQLKLPAAGANRCIPPYNGVFIWGADNTKEYLYKKAEFKDNTVTLRGITKMDGSPVATGFVAGYSQISVYKNPYRIFSRPLAYGQMRIVEKDGACTYHYCGFAGADLVVESLGDGVRDFERRQLGAHSTRSPCNYEFL